MKNKASLSVIFITIFIDLMGFGILIPILPTFASKQLGISDLGIGVIIAIYSLMQFIFNPVFGRLSDIIGRRPIMLATQSLTVVAYLLFALSNSFELLLISRLLAGLGGSNIGVAQAYIADITSKEERSKGMAIIGAAFGLGFVFGPVIGAVLSKYSYSVAGFGSAAFSFIALGFALFMLPESLKEKKSAEKFQFRVFDFAFTKKIVLHSSVGFLIVLFFFIIFSVANIYGTYSLLGYRVFHFTDQQNGMLFGLTGIVGVLIQIGLIRTLTKKFSDRTIVLIGLVFTVIGLAFIPYGGNFLGEAIVISILAVGTGILQPIIPSMISKYSPENQQGAILGVNQSISAFARVLGPLWGGFSFHYIGYQFPFLTGAFFTLLILVVSYFKLDPEKMKAKENV
ncbi:MAG: major facilitator superfamily protein [Ignavibacteria bacterium]|nr:MAG: major facilitator superfamily protein [Ignavibacteria bacterium]KAF0161959.1 MAG: major facilitator superfamily protein [Ignavibacteria bacterium]